MSDAFEIPHVVAFSDASHAPMKSTGRRGVTGGGADLWLLLYQDLE